MNDLFSLDESFGDDDPPRMSSAARPTVPLAVRMRPRALDDLVGQDHLLSPGSPLRRLVEPGEGAAGHSSLVLWGPPGSGKTTVAQVVSASAGVTSAELSAVTAGVKDVRLVLERAREDRELYHRRTVLFLDEIHRFTKAQQDALLPAVENGWVTLIAATTENPSFSVIAPLLSRSLLLTLRPLDDAAIRVLIDRAVAAERGLQGAVAPTAEAVDHLIRLAAGDARRALTVMEAAAGAALAEAESASHLTVPVPLTVAHVAKALDVAVVRYDRDGDQHYDVTSALIKSIRGSDVDASLHYLARMLHAGEDPRFIARRLIVLAAEDIGLADPSALSAAVAAAQAVQFIGLPEGRIPLAQVVIHLASAPKSNAVFQALSAAERDVKAGRIGVVPVHLRDAHYPAAAKLGHGSRYRYPHDEPHAIVAQQYFPDSLRGRRYYDPTDRGAEQHLKARVDRLRRILDDRESTIE
ncbi:MAG: replication-associated recombination protein A [Actinomycetota bacterium]